MIMFFQCSQHSVIPIPSIFYYFVYPLYIINKHALWKTTSFFIFICFMLSFWGTTNDRSMTAYEYSSLLKCWLCHWNCLPNDTASHAIKLESSSTTVYEPQISHYIYIYDCNTVYVIFYTVANMNVYKEKYFLPRECTLQPWVWEVPLYQQIWLHFVSSYLLFHQDNHK